MATSSSGSPESFSMLVLSGQAAVFGSTTVTPPGPTPCAYRVDGTVAELTESVVSAWFIQSIVPLVGEDAAGVLKNFIEKDDHGSDFVRKALEFRKQF